jgi:hypothetical protein
MPYHHQQEGHLWSQEAPVTAAAGLVVVLLAAVELPRMLQQQQK